MRILLLASALAFAGLSTGAGPAAHATSCTTSWKNATSGDWTTAANWTNGVPDGTSFVCITIAGTYTVKLDANTHVTALDLGGTDGSQTLDVQGSCAAQVAALQAAAPSTVGRHAVLAVDAAGCATVVNLTSVTNHGVIELEGAHGPGLGAGLLSDLFVNDGTIAVNAVATGSGTWQNNGKIKIVNNASLEMQGTGITNDGTITARGTGNINFVDSGYEQGAGRIVGGHAVVMDYGTLTYSGAGSGTVEIAGGTTEVAGNISAGQTLVVDSDCGGSFATAKSNQRLTNRGTIVLESRGAPCYDIAGLDAPKLVNRGTVIATPVPGTTGPAGMSISGPVVNDKSFTVAAGAGVVLDGAFVNEATANLTFGVASASSFGRFTDEGEPFTFDGTLTIDTDASFWPAAGLDLQVVKGSTRTGTFATVKGTQRAGQAVRYSVLYDDTSAPDALVSLTTG